MLNVEKKTVIRKGVFETNSSSSHAISISENSGILDLPRVNKEGLVVIDSKDFGWEWHNYRNVEAKLAYVFEYENCKLIELAKEACTKHTCCTDVIMRDSLEGYIDHQALEQNVLSDIQTVEDMANFLFNKDSYVRTGNDNEDDPCD